MERREEVNYKKSRYAEPNVPDYFKYAGNTNLRIMLEAYRSNTVYAFDPDHAIVAYPFCLLHNLRSRLLTNSITPLLSIESDFLSNSIKDRNGVITAMSLILA
jgi:hypothetical protein